MPYKDPMQQRAFQRGRLVRYKKRIQELKESTPCADCGTFYPYYVMQFDHVRGTKSKNVSRMQSQRSSVIDVEIAKCDLVCANCHAVRTYERLDVAQSG